MSRKKGLLVVISAPSGGGKTTIVNAVREEMQLEYSVSTTTRPPRKGEKDGIHYNFVSKKDFLRYIEGDKFAEWAEVHGNLYGTEKSLLEQKIRRGEAVLLDIDVQGASSIKARFPEAMLIFISPPSMKVLKDRLIKRGTESGDSLKARLARAECEMKKSVFYDHVVVNDNIEQAVEEVQGLIRNRIQIQEGKGK